MRSFLPFLLAFSLLAGARAQDPDSAAFYPEDTSILFGIRDLTKLFDLPDDHPIKELVKNPGVEELFGDFTSESPFDEEFLTDVGMTKEELARAFPGHFTLGLRLPFDMLLASLTAPAGIEGDEPEPEMAFTAACTLSEDQLADLLDGIVVNENRPDEDASPDDPVSKHTLVRQPDAGLTVFRMEIENDGELDEPIAHFVLVEGTLVVALTGKEAAKGLGDGYFADVVRRVESDGKEDGSLASTDAYLDASEKIGSADFFSYAPLETIAEIIDEMISTSYDQAVEEGSPVGMFATKDGILKMAGLGDFKALTVAGTVVPDGADFLVELSFNERTGILSRLLNYEGRGVELPEFAPEGVTSIATTSLNTGAIFEEIFVAVKEVSPMASGLVDTQFAELEKQGLSIRKGIFGSLAPGNTVVGGYSGDVVPHDTISSKLLVYNLSDPKGMEGAAAGVRAYFEKMGAEAAEKRDYMGVTIHRMDDLADFFSSIVDVDAEASLSYAIVGNRLLIAVGEADFMEHGIASMKEKGATLVDDPAVAEAWARWDDRDMVEFFYQDLADFLKTVAVSSAAEADLVSDFADPELEEDLTNELGLGDEEPAEIPTFEDVHHFLVAKTYDTPNALTIRIAIAKKPE